MKYIKFDYSIDENFDIFKSEQKALRAYTDLNNMTFSKMTGWADVDKILTNEEKLEIKEIAKEVRENAKVLVVIGIGGSYLGAKAAIDFLSDYYEQGKDLEIIYLGNSLSEKYIKDTIKHIGDRDFYINVISKSGTTLEPSIAFNILKKICEDKYKKDYKKHIIATTSKDTGVLRAMSDKEGFRTFIIPDNIGGRFSVLSAVGLFPIACAGFSIEKILNGAKATEEEIKNVDFKNNMAFHYAAIRNYLYKQGKDIEVFSTFNPNMRYFLEWLKQLFGESECKDKGGIFPASLVLSTDLHSMGQLMQQGKRNLFETFINSNKENIDSHIYINESKDDIDKLNYIKKIDINEINKVARVATMRAHKTGDVPIIDIEIEEQNENTLGALFYFFEFSCAISAYMFNVNPFDQPGVENYKSNIKTILNK